MTDYAVEFTDIRDDSTFDRRGDPQRWKRYTFFIGKHGPFVERVPIDQAQDATEINARVERLKLQLRTLAT